MVVSGNDHLNDRNYCNWAAIEHYSRFQIDKERNGVCLWCEGCVGLSKDRRRWRRERGFYHKKRENYRRSQLLIFLPLHLFFSSPALPFWAVFSEHFSPPSYISSSSYTPLSSLLCCCPHLPPLPPPNLLLLLLHFTLWLMSTAVWRAVWSRERDRARKEKRYAERKWGRGGHGEKKKKRERGEWRNSDRLSVCLIWAGFLPPAAQGASPQKHGQV